MKTTRAETILSSRFVSGLLAPRKADSQKYDFGHVLIVAGSSGMTGAAVLCAHGALRSGAGLVTLAFPAGETGAVTPRLHPEVMTLPLPAKNGALDTPAVKTIENYIDARRVSAVVAGPGMGNTPGVERFFARLFARARIPLILDADALNAAARSAGARTSLLSARGPVILTPHAGELARLLGCGTDGVSSDRTGAAVRCAKQFRAVCVLKGRRTVITDGKRIFINPTGNPGMATAGAGDVLAGMMGALYAQVREPRALDAASAAVFLHGTAGDLAAAEKTEIAMTAGDIIDHIPSAVKKLVR